MSIPEKYACPYLGFQEDPQTRTVSSSRRNWCHHLRTPAPVDLEYQQQTCLGDGFKKCPVFSGDPQRRLPKNARAVERRTARAVFWRRFWIVFLLLLVVGGGIVGIDALLKGNFASLLQSASMTPTAMVSLAAATRTIQQSSPTPGQQVTETALLPLSLETPIGKNPTLLIHKVLDGENLEGIAHRYATSVDAILAINDNPQVPVWTDELLVIAVGESDVSGLPKFEAYQVKDPEITLQQLAALLGIDPTLLCRYNYGENNTVLALDQWIIVPHVRP